MNNLPDFSAFLPATEAQWKALVQKELGDKPLDSLLHADRNGVKLGPYHTHTKHGIHGVPGWPLSIGILQSMPSGNVEWAHALALECLEGGATAIAFSGDVPVQQALKDIFFEFAPVYIHTQHPHKALREWIDLAASRGKNAAALNGGIFVTNCDVDFTRDVIATGSKLQSIEIDTTDVHQLGGTGAQALAIGLHRGHRALVQCLDAGISTDDASAQILFRFAIGSSYFAEIAGLRAFRVLWQTIVKAYAPQHACSMACSIAAVTSPYLQTIPDMHSNLLRATTQAMSAIIGGANNIEVTPFDAATGEPSVEGYRWARNVVHLLFEESRFQNIGDVSSGAYYIENLTEATGTAVWSLFQQLDAGTLTEAQCLELAKQEGMKWQQAVASGQEHVLGVTRFPAPFDAALPHGIAGRLSTAAETTWHKGGKA
jgi:methylmalonyl-CoA mutase